MIIKKEFQAKIKNILVTNVEKLGDTISRYENIDYISDSLSKTLLKDNVYQQLYITRAFFVMQIIMIIARINEVVTLGSKISGLGILYKQLNKDIKERLSNAELDYIDVQFLYKSSREITKDFLRCSKDEKEKRYYCKNSIDVYQIIEDIEKFNFAVKYVLIKNKEKKGIEENGENK